MMLRSVLALVVLSLGLMPCPAAGAGVDPALLAGMKARSIGPAGMSGRVCVVEGVVSDPNVYYVGVSTGGLWKSVDGGLTWNPLFDDQPVHSIGAVAVNQSHPDIVWVGTGEGNLRNSVSIGNGMYKSLDGGRTWSYLGLPESERIHRIRLDPRDPEVAYVAVMGKLWGDSKERGVYKTEDGGATWQRVLYVDERTGCGDLEMDPTNPDKLFAGMYEFRRWPWFFESGGWGSGLHVTVDGGATWRRVTPEDGFPEGKLGRIGVAVAPSDPRIVYAFVEAEKDAFMRSEDGGVTWKNTGAERLIGGRPFYYADIRVDPEYPDRIYSLWSLVSVSEDGGKTWTVLIPFSTLHPDHHAMWIHPRDGNLLIEGNDGGVGMSTDRGKTWRYVNNLPVAQFYHIAVDMDQPYHVYGGMQDNGSWRGAAYVWENGGIRNHHWQEVYFGDGFDTRPYPGDSMEGYAMSQEGYLARWNLRTGERRSIRPAAEPGDTLRFNWNAGLAQDPFDPETIYFGSQYLYRSGDRGDTWTRISGDLTSDRPAWQQQRKSGGLTPDVSGAENFTTIIAIAPSPVDRGVIWVGTDDGRIHVTRDGGATWTSLEHRAKGVPAHSWVPHIGASPHDAGTAFVVFDDHRRSNPEPYAFQVGDYGRRWRSLVTPDIRGYCLAVEQDPVDPELLFLGTEFGLYVSLDGGRAWMPFRHGIPTASVMDLVVHPREHDLIVGTHGRSAYVLDDIRPLRSLGDDIVAKKIHLFDPPPAQQYAPQQTAGARFPGATEYRGENRPYGAMLTFWLEDPTLPHPDDEVERGNKQRKRDAERAGEAPAPVKEAKEPGASPVVGKEGDPKSKGPKIKITIRDAAGKQVRTFEHPVHRGLNRAIWDLRADPVKEPPRPGGWWEDEPTGLEILPGEYEVTLVYLESRAGGRITVAPDPRAEIDQDARRAAWEAGNRAGKLVETVALAVDRLEGTRKDVEFLIEKIRGMQAERKRIRERDAAGTEVPASDAELDSLNVLLKETEALGAQVKALDRRLRAPRGTKGFGSEIYILSEVREAQEHLASSWDRPTPAMLGYLELARTDLESFLIDLNAFYAKDVAAFRSRVRSKELSFLPEVTPLEMAP